MKFLVIIILAIPSILSAQVNVTGFVTNAALDALPYSNIVLLRKNTGTVTNEKGLFNLSNLLSDDSIKISNVGFHSRIIAVKDLKNGDSILLTNSIEQLPGIHLRNFLNYQRESELGFFHHSSNGAFQLIPGNQIAIYISNESNKEGWIKSVDFKIKDFGKCRNTFRVRILANDNQYFSPAADLLNENVIIESGTLKKTNHIDLSNYRIIMPPEGIFIVLEWIDAGNECEKNSFVSIAATLTVPDNIVWLNFRDRAWSKNHRPRLPNGNYMTPNIGLTVAYR